MRTIPYLYKMKSKAKIPAKKQKPLREEILHSARASFKIEGIHISAVDAKATLKKVELSLGK